MAEARSGEIGAPVVLVVDDDELSRELLIVLLEAEGYSVYAADSGAAALALLHDIPADGALVPALILTDLQMPGLSGSELGVALRATAPPGTRLLAMSGSQPSASMAEFDDFLLKPFTIAELRAAVSGSADGVPALRVPAGSPVAPPVAPPLDEGIFAKLAETMPAAQLAQIFAMFLADARSRVERMRVLAEAEDDPGYRAAAHAIKGGAGMLGASEIYRMAAVAEEDGRGQSPNGTPDNTQVIDSLRRFHVAFDRLEGMLLERVT